MILMQQRWTYFIKLHFHFTNPILFSSIVPNDQFLLLHSSTSRYLLVRNILVLIYVLFIEIYLQVMRPLCTQQGNMHMQLFLFIYNSVTVLHKLTKAHFPLQLQKIASENYMHAIGILLKHTISLILMFCFAKCFISIWL